MNLTTGSLLLLILSGIHSAPERRRTSVAKEDQLRGLIGIENDGAKAWYNAKAGGTDELSGPDNKDDA